MMNYIYNKAESPIPGTPLFISVFYCDVYLHCNSQFSNVKFYQEDYGKLEEKLTETSKSLAESQNSQLLLKEKFETNKCTYTEEVNTLRCHLENLTCVLDKERSR